MRVFQSINDPEVASLLNSGAVGVLPSDTVYGLMCQAADEAAVHKMYSIKHRDERKPGTVIAASIEQLVKLGLKERYLKAVQQYWPGPLSVLIPQATQTYLVNPETMATGVRIPDDAALCKLLEQTGALQTTSANIAGQPMATRLAEAQSYFGDTVDFYVEGGDLSGRPPSTVIRIVDDAIEILREGAVKIDENGRLL
jgi:tRNA threonylcarbamoyl adenosine modification protein (Sua5/YciO/YrdC/YwlC family)